MDSVLPSYLPSHLAQQVGRRKRLTQLENRLPSHQPYLPRVRAGARVWAGARIRELSGRTR